MRPEKCERGGDARIADPQSLGIARSNAEALIPAATSCQGLLVTPVAARCGVAGELTRAGLDQLNVAGKPALLRSYRLQEGRR
jgi:hypothetical protein